MKGTVSKRHGVSESEVNKAEEARVRQRQTQSRTRAGGHNDRQ